jgi:hypothetical protein
LLHWIPSKRFLRAILQGGHAEGVIARQSRRSFDKLPPSRKTSVGKQNRWRDRLMDIWPVHQQRSESVPWKEDMNEVAQVVGRTDFRYHAFGSIKISYAVIVLF